VNDCLSGAPTISDADHIRGELCDLLKSAGMTLRKWRSNSIDFRKTIPPYLIETADLQLPSPLNSPKALGICWDVSDDTLQVFVPEVENRTITKRYIASITAKIYDILGLFAPAVIPAKLLLQELWRSGLGWDASIPEDIASKWSAWTSELSHLANHPITRRLVKEDNPVEFRSLHGFSDASQQANGAAIYLRTIYKDTTASISFIFSKARVAPLSSTSIPRLELVAAHLLSKLLPYVAKLLNIDISHTFAWTDSSIVLCWLQKSPTTLKTFVAHRIAYIHPTVGLGTSVETRVIC